MTTRNAITKNGKRKREEDCFDRLCMTLFRQKKKVRAKEFCEFFIHLDHSLRIEWRNGKRVKITNEMDILVFFSNGSAVVQVNGLSELKLEHLNHFLMFINRCNNAQDMIPEEHWDKYSLSSPDFPSLAGKKQSIQNWINSCDLSTILITKFNLSISRLNLKTLQWNPLTLLNDEVINFYMELLAERSRLEKELPNVHCMNTFFLKRLLESGYSGVRRWTKNVNIFAYDIILVPVHIESKSRRSKDHWCMAIIHVKNKTIKYYDSMGAPNHSALNALAKYLRAESLDKKKVKFECGWKWENVQNIPQQENGSDCGVFCCFFAEFVTRNRPIVFSQHHMQYFRMKMVYEICTGQMLN